MTRRRYATLEADPPWQFRDKLPGAKRGASSHYDCMTLAELCDFELPPLLPSCHLLLWRVSAMQREAIDLMEAWGFTPKAELVWIKTTTTGLRHFGMGRIVRAEHEVCLIGTRGRPSVLNHSTRSTFEAPVGKHSEKPDEFYRLAAKLFAGPRCSLFQRRGRPGWQCFGNELQEAG